MYTRVIINWFKIIIVILDKSRLDDDRNGLYTRANAKLMPKNMRYVSIKKIGILFSLYNIPFSNISDKSPK